MVDFDWGYFATVVGSFGVGSAIATGIATSCMIRFQKRKYLHQLKFAHYQQLLYLGPEIREDVAIYPSSVRLYFELAGGANEKETAILFTKLVEESYTKIIRKLNRYTILISESKQFYHKQSTLKQCEDSVVSCNKTSEKIGYIFSYTSEPTCIEINEIMKRIIRDHDIIITCLRTELEDFR